MEIITGYTGKPHVTSEQDRDVNIGVVGEESYVLQTGMQLAAEVSSNNEIKIRDGVLMHQGCTASIKKNTYDSLTIINGSQGMKRIDLIVARYEKNKDDGTESLDLKVIQGTPAESNPAVPEYTVGDIQAGDYVADMPMYQVVIDGLNITEIKKVFEIAPSLAELNSNMIRAFNITCPNLNAKANTLTKISLMSKVDFDAALKNAGCTQALGFCALSATYEDQIQCTFSLHPSAGLYVQLDSRWGADLTVQPVCCVIAK